jgi:hypothetical protein
MNCHKSLARSYLTTGRAFALGGFDTPPKAFCLEEADTPNVMMARGGISNVNGKKGRELRETNSCDPSKLERPFCR